MTPAPQIHILWDASHIWGLMAWKALTAFGLQSRLSKGKEIADGCLLGKHRGAILLVPGGNARLKAEALGSRGLAAIRAFVDAGGSYLGFCGGAGLALKNSTKDSSLSLCPWQRKPYPDRLQHLASGHVRALVADNKYVPETLRGESLELPVWWPGRFSPGSEREVTILAKANSCASDFWLGDLPLATIPDDCFVSWKNEYGLDLTADFLADTPLVIRGDYGRGRYLLSYSHLETPESVGANFWLSEELCQMTGQKTACSVLPPWDLENETLNWPDTPQYRPLFDALKTTRRLLALGVLQHLLFRRTAWLWGWRTGIAGAGLNYLHAALTTLLARIPTTQAKAFWLDEAQRFTRILPIFSAAAEENLLTCRISDVIGTVMTNTVRAKDLSERRNAVFGSPRDGGGLLGTLLAIVEELIFLTQGIERM